MLAGSSDDFTDDEVSMRTKSNSEAEDLFIDEFEGNGTEV